MKEGVKDMIFILNSNHTSFELLLHGLKGHCPQFTRRRGNVCPSCQGNMPPGHYVSFRGVMGNRWLLETVLENQSQRN